MSRLLRWLMFIGAFLCGDIACAQQNWPARPLRVVVSNSPGGAPDLAARRLGQHLQRHTKVEPAWAARGARWKRVVPAAFIYEDEPGRVLVFLAEQCEGPEFFRVLKRAFHFKNGIIFPYRPGRHGLYLRQLFF